MNILGLRRHFNSPLSFTNVDALATSPPNSVNQDSQDNKDVLLQRLNDLVVRLSHDDAEDAAITALHKKTDEIETLLRVEYSMDLDPKMSQNKVKPPPRRDSTDVFWGRPLNARRESYLRRPSSPPPMSHSTSYNRTAVAVARAAEIATSAEELNVRLAKAVGELQASRIESDVSFHESTNFQYQGIIAHAFFVENSCLARVQVGRMHGGNQSFGGTYFKSVGVDSEFILPPFLSLFSCPLFP